MHIIVFFVKKRSWSEHGNMNIKSEVYEDTDAAHIKIMFAEWETGKLQFI
jgi:hypothetical protein